MAHVEFQWLLGESSLKEVLQGTLNCSGQLLKRYFSSKELSKKISHKDYLKVPLDLVNHLKVNPEYQGPQAHIIRETSAYLAVHKPPGIHGHPLCYSDQNTILNFLASERKWDALKVNEKNYDRGLLYRLDFETSGVILLAKTEEFHLKIRQGFSKEIKKKIYLAIVEGSFDKEGTWTHHFKAVGIKGGKQKVSLESHLDAQPGTFKVTKLQEANGKSLLLIHLETGLRHQIRAQLSVLGFPILGDELYGASRAERLYLHAWRYEWDNDFVEDKKAELFDRFFDLNSAL